MNFKIYLRSTCKAIADGEKEGKMEIQKLEYLENKKSFLHEIRMDDWDSWFSSIFLNWNL